MLRELKNKKFKKIGVIKDVINQTSKFTKHIYSKVNKINLDFFWSNKLKHLRHTSTSPKEYFKDYLMTVSHSKEINDLQKSQIKKINLLCKNLSLERNSLIEIGCGDGSFIKKISRYFKNVNGVEISAKAAKIARSNKIKVFSKNINQIQKRYDVFVCRQVLEHISEPHIFLKQVYKLINFGGLGLIEVPNGFKALKDKEPWNFFQDHIQYYSINSLVELASECGFNVISCNSTFKDNYLEIFLYKDKIDQKYFKEINLKRDKLFNQLEVIFNKHFNDDTSLVWGYGEKTFSFLSNINTKYLKKITAIIDTDKHKHNFFFSRFKNKSYFTKGSTKIKTKINYVTISWA